MRRVDVPTVSVEDRINQLADALDMPLGDLTRAIAATVREYVPSASLLSVSAEAKKMGGTQVIDHLLREDAAKRRMQPTRPLACLSVSPAWMGRPRRYPAGVGTLGSRGKQDVIRDDD